MKVQVLVLDRPRKWYELKDKTHWEDTHYESFENMKKMNWHFVSKDKYGNSIMVRFEHLNVFREVA